jgi:glucokinase
MQLLSFLRHSQGHKHVSWERLVSGKFGLPNLYLFATRELGLVATIPDLEHAVIEGSRPVEALMTAANSNDPVASKVLHMFMTLMGQETGNLALKVLATGGVFISGGLTQRMKVLLKGKYLDAFREGMCAKGRFRPLLARLPVTFLEDHQTALKGAMASVALSVKA